MPGPLVMAVVVTAVLAAAPGCGRGQPADPPAATIPPSSPAPVTPAPEADVQLDIRHQYDPVTATVATPEPAVVALPDTGDLAARLAAEPDLDAVVTVDLDRLPATPDLSLRVFVDTADVDADTPASDPGFVGTVAFFPLDRPDDPVRAVLPAGGAIERVGATGPLTVTLVPVPYPDRSMEPQRFDVTVAAALVATPTGE